MDNYFMLDGKKIPMSNETAEGLREARSKYEPFEAEFDGIRVSEKEGDGAGEAFYPVRISIIDNCVCGLRTGGYSDMNGGDLPGDTLSISSAKKLILAIQECIDRHEASQKR